MTGDPHEPRCDWLQRARLEFRSNAIIFHDETFVKMVAVEEIINRLSEERQRCYKAHSDAKEINQHEPSLNRCHTCRTLQWDNRLIWSLESLLAWVRANHMDQIDIRDHIDLMLGEYRQELEARRENHSVPSELAVDAIISDLSQRSCLGKCWGNIDLETRSGIREVWREKISQQIGAVVFAIKQEKYFAMEQTALKRQSVEQCKNCRLAGSRACIYHGYPESEIPYSCSYKIGESAIEALHDLDGTFIDVWTVEGHRSKIGAAEARGREDERKKMLEKIDEYINTHAPWLAGTDDRVVDARKLISFTRSLRSTTPSVDNQPAIHNLDDVYREVSKILPKEQWYRFEMVRSGDKRRIIISDEGF